MWLVVFTFFVKTKPVVNFWDIKKPPILVDGFLIYVLSLFSIEFMFPSSAKKYGQSQQ